ncbi:MAG: membrane protein insertase YidC, partial [Bacteroidota bacterium]
MDKNQLIGVVLLVLLMAGYYIFVPRPEPVADTPTADSVQTEKPKAAFKQATDLPDSVKQQIALSNYGSFADLVTEEAGAKFTVSNSVADFVFSTKGGAINAVTLKNFKTYSGNALTLIDGNNSQLDLNFMSQGKQINVADLSFNTGNTTTSVAEGDSLAIVFVAQLAGGQEIRQTYLIRGNSYVVDYSIQGRGLNDLVGQENLSYYWKTDLYQLEKDITEERTRTNLIYSQNNS